VSRRDYPRGPNTLEGSSGAISHVGGGTESGSGEITVPSKFANHTRVFERMLGKKTMGGKSPWGRRELVNDVK